MNKVGVGILFAVGLVFLIGGSVFVGIFPGILKNKINEEIPLTNGSDALKRWEETKVPISMKFHFFEVNNSDTFKSLDDIELVERGPYIYNEKRFKNNTQHIGKDLISYQEHKTYTFREGQQVNENEKISLINFPILGILQNKLDKINYLMKLLYWATTYKKPETETNLVMRMKPVDILFNGVPYKVFTKLATAYKNVGITEKYSIYPAKDFDEERWTVNTGVNDINKIGQIQKFDGSDYLSNNIDALMKSMNPDLQWIWPYNNTAEYNCSTLRGTDGTFFSPAVSKDDILYAFEPQLCRPVFFEFWEESEVRGISTYRFKLHKDFYRSPFDQKNNMCYCTEKEDKTECNRNGLLDVSHCMRRSFGAPIIMSSPYFLNGDHENRDNLRLKPKQALNEKNYGTYVDVEPMTGTVLRAVRRLQMNVQVKVPKVASDVKLINTFMPKIMDSDKNTTEYIVPVFWVEEFGEADEAQADEFKSMVTNKKKLANGIGITVIVVGAILTIASIYLFIRK